MGSSAWRRGLSAAFYRSGNGGTGLSTDPKIEGVKLNAADFPAMIKFAQDKGVTLVVPGPEQPLVDGIADAMKKGVLVLLR